MEKFFKHFQIVFSSNSFGSSLIITEKIWAYDAFSGDCTPHLAHHTTLNLDESRSLQDGFRIFCSSSLSTVPVYSSRQMKNSLVAEPNVVQGGWVVFVVVEQCFAHFYPAIIIFFFEYTCSLPLVWECLNILRNIR